MALPPSAALWLRPSKPVGGPCPKNRWPRTEHGAPANCRERSLRRLQTSPPLSMCCVRAFSTPRGGRAGRLQARLKLSSSCWQTAGTAQVYVIPPAPHSHRRATASPNSAQLQPLNALLQAPSPPAQKPCKRLHSLGWLSKRARMQCCQDGLSQREQVMPSMQVQHHSPSASAALLVTHVALLCRLIDHRGCTRHVTAVQAPAGAAGG